MSESWNYLQNGAAQGPVPGDVLRAMLASGQLSGDDLVWRPGLSEWTRAEQFPELRPAPAAAPAPAIQLDTPPIQVAAPASDNVPSGPVTLFAPPAAAAPGLEDAIAALRATKPWARFLAVLGFIGTGFMALVGLGILLMAGLLPDTMMGAFPKPLRFVLPLIYLAMALLQLPPVLSLNRYASRIGTLVRSRDPQDLAPALEAQKSFWRYVGIFALVMVILYFLVFLGVIAAGVLSGVARRV